MIKSLEDLQNTMAEKDKALRIAENERDLLEKEKVLFDSQIKVYRHQINAFHFVGRCTVQNHMTLITVCCDWMRQKQ
jgi:hypothetical protein